MALNHPALFYEVFSGYLLRIRLAMRRYSASEMTFSSRSRLLKNSSQIRAARSRRRVSLDCMANLLSLVRFTLVRLKLFYRDNICL